MLRAHKILCFVGALGLGGPALADTTNLVCVGAVGKDATFIPNGDRVNFDDSVGVRIGEDGSGEVRVPKKLLPLYRDGGKDGWYPIIKLVSGRDEITGQVRMNSNYKPKLRLDRITGRITLQGALGDFSGSCEKYDPASTQRKF